MTKPQVDAALKKDNAFALIGMVARALNRAGSPDLAKTYQKRAMNSPSHEALLQMTAEYVDFV